MPPSLFVIFQNHCEVMVKVRKHLFTIFSGRDLTQMDPHCGSQCSEGEAHAQAQAVQGCGDGSPVPAGAAFLLSACLRPWSAPPGHRGGPSVSPGVPATFLARGGHAGRRPSPCTVFIWEDMAAW